jgi:hypothetical protein
MSPFPQPELHRVLYPMFVHCYLELVSRNATGTAVELLRKYRQALLDMCRRASAARAQVSCAR